MRTSLTVIAGSILVLLICAFLSASSQPVVRQFRYAPSPWPVSAQPLRLVLLTDTHVSGPDMPPARLARIVAQINALHPDLVLLGGDFVSATKIGATRYPVAEALAPLAALHAPSGVIAVMGNHDHWSDLTAIHSVLSRLGIAVLDNTAVRRGDFVIGGVDDAYTGHEDVRTVVKAMDGLGGIPILLSHSPDVFPNIPSRVGLVMAGHTHCGQVALPLLGPIFTMSRYGKRYACGVIQNGHQRLIVSAGVGTSVLPLRLNAPPDIWVIDAGPSAKT